MVYSSMKGVSQAESIKDSSLRKASKKSLLYGTIKSIDLRDKQWMGNKEKKIPAYASVTIDFPNGACASLPCTLSEAGEYEVGSKVHVKLSLDDYDTDDS